MGQSRQWINLEECISQYMDEAEISIHKQVKLTQLAFRAVDELGLDFFYKVQSFKLSRNANYTVDIPPNCLRVIKAGILNGNGEVIPLSINNKLTTYADLLPDRVAKTQDNSLFNWNAPCNVVFYNYWNGNSYINFYGIPSGSPFVGSYKVDEHAGIILLNETFAFDYIILECLVSYNQDETCYVPIQFKEAIISYLAWTDIRSLNNSRRGGLSDKRDRRKEYYNQRRLAIARYRPFKMEEAYEINLQSQRMAIKG